MAAEPTRRLASATTALATVAATISASVIAAGTAAAAPSGPKIVPFASVLRHCDQTAANFDPVRGVATGYALLSSTQRDVVAEVHLQSAHPGTRYLVTLIQVPRPTSATCESGDPGVTGGVLDTDAGGNAVATLRGPIQSGATGAWVDVEIPSDHSQSPIEYYTSDFVGPI